MPNAHAMKVVQVVGAVSIEASGPSHTVPALCDALATNGADVALHVLHWEDHVHHASNYRTVQHRLLSELTRRLGVSPSMRDALRQEARGADIMHHHGLWLMPNVYAARAVRGTRCKLVSSPRGVLSAWALRHSRIKKRVMWWVNQGDALRRSDCLHATAESEWQEIRALGLRAPVAIIPNGVDIPAEVTRDRSPGTRRRLLFLGRLHQKKGVDILLRAWSEVAPKADDWELTIAGPIDSDYARNLQGLAAELRAPRVHFVGALYGADKASALASADLFVLPTHSENFGMAVAEGLASGAPAIVSKGAPWQGLEREECGWWIDVGVEPLVAALREALGKDDETLSALGARGRAWMQRDFSWATVGRRMTDVYEWLLGGGALPPWIRV